MPALTQHGKDALDSFMEKVGKEGKLPALVAGVTTADEEIYFNDSGSNVNGSVHLDAVFFLGNMTEPITHVAALQLIETGELDPETPVADIVPQMKNPVLIEGDGFLDATPSVIGPSTVPMRVKHLLYFTHGMYMQQNLTSGTMLCPALTNEYEMEDKHSAYIDAIKGSLPGVGLTHEPGFEFAMDLGSDILGMVIENITGVTLDEYMQKNIFQPLGITSSFYLTGGLKERFMTISYRRFVDNRLEPFAHQPDTRLIPQDPNKVMCLGSMGLYMSLRDYLSFLRHILQILDGKATNPIIGLETAKSLFVPTLPRKGWEETFCTKLAIYGAPPMSLTNAMGVNTVDWPKRRKAGSGHCGGWLGTYFWIDPTTGVAGVTGLHLLSVYSGAFDPEVIKMNAEFEEIVYRSLQYD